MTCSPLERIEWNRSGVLARAGVGGIEPVHDVRRVHSEDKQVDGLRVQIRIRGREGRIRRDDRSVFESSRPVLACEQTYAHVPGESRFPAPSPWLQTLLRTIRGDASPRRAPRRQPRRPPSFPPRPKCELGCPDPDVPFRCVPGSARERQPRPSPAARVLPRRWSPQARDPRRALGDHRATSDILRNPRRGSRASPLDFGGIPLSTSEKSCSSVRCFMGHP